jgi:hypothetical protein
MPSRVVDTVKSLRGAMTNCGPAETRLARVASPKNLPLAGNSGSKVLLLLSCGSSSPLAALKCRASAGCHFRSR